MTYGFIWLKGKIHSCRKDGNIVHALVLELAESAFRYSHCMWMFDAREFSRKAMYALAPKHRLTSGFRKKTSNTVQIRLGSAAG